MRDGFLRTKAARLPAGRLEPRRRDVIHAIAEFDADGVFSLAQQIRDVARVVKAGFVIFRPAGRKKIIADLFPVERHFILAEAADIHERAFEAGLDDKIAAQEQGFAIRRRGDPSGVPVVRVEQTHRPDGRLAPTGRLVCLVPYADLPKNLFRRFQRPAGVGNLDGFVGGNPAAVPQVTFVICQLFQRRGGENLAGGLVLAALVAVIHPKQARLRYVNAHRVDRVLATQMRGRQGGTGPRRPGANQQQRDQ